MARYMVERDLPGFTSEDLRGAARAARETTTAMSREGTPVRYLRSTFVPSEAKCFCLFEGASIDVIRQANERAKLPFTRIHEAEFVTAEEVG